MEELSVVPPVGSYLRCASVGMPLGISNGMLEQVIVRVKDSESPFQKIRCTSCAYDRPPLSWV